VTIVRAVTASVGASRLFSVADSFYYFTIFALQTDISVAVATRTGISRR